MNRAMFSGVANLKAHQTKMDVIGNNIANVNTYGFRPSVPCSAISITKPSRARRRHHQPRRQQPLQRGLWLRSGTIQTQMSQSSMQNTGFGMDVAIGSGSGHIFYTKAGMLDYDSNGYLTDINGNFVLKPPAR